MHNGQKILEIKPPELNKGAAVIRLLKTSHDFVLAMGDDYTDENMFRNVPRSAFTIRVGRGKTAARYRIKDVKHVQELLSELGQL